MTRKVRLIPGVGPENSRAALAAKKKAEKKTQPVEEAAAVPAVVPEPRIFPVVLPRKSEFGPAMQALNERQRKFVVAWIESGLGYGSIKLAYLRAGYNDTPNARSNASHLSRQKKIKAALSEEMAEREGHVSWRAKSRVMEIVESEDDETALKAAKLALEFSGAMVKRVDVRHTHEIENLSTAEIDKRIAELLGNLSDQDRLRLGVAGNVVEGEFSEVAESVAELREVGQSQTVEGAGHDVRDAGGNSEMADSGVPVQT